MHASHMASKGGVATRPAVVLLVGLLALLPGCGGSGSGSGAGGGGGSGEPSGLQILITDAPIDPQLVEEANVWIERISMHNQAEDDGSGWIDVYETDTPDKINLKDLLNGKAHLLTEADVAPGTYRQVRLHFSRAELLLTNQNFYTTEDGSLQLTSQATSGQKVFIDPPVVITENDDAGSLLLDFDLTKSFRPIPANDPPNASRYQLGPVIQAVHMTDTSGIRGTVTDADDGGAPVEGATVDIYNAGADPDADDPVGGAITDADGYYADMTIAPGGTYDVYARKDLKEGWSLGHATTAGYWTTVDISITAFGWIAGTVFDGDTAGNPPVVGATVRIFNAGDDPNVDLPVADVVTGASGAYASGDLLPGDYDVYGSNGDAVDETLGVTVFVNTTTTVDLLLVTPPGGISGVVTNADAGGALVDGATVEVFNDGDDPNVDTPVDSTTTSPTGQYSFSALFPGTYDVYAEKGALVGEAQDVTVNSGQTTENVDISIAMPPP